MDGNKEKSSKEAFRCFQCNKTRHIKVDCPFPQNKKKNYIYKQAMKATQSDDSYFSLSDDEEEHVANKCFMEIESDNEESMEYREWFLDSVCLRHMIRDDSLFSSITKINSENVMFIDNSKGKFIGIGNI